jgi:hypothetical protein
MPTTMLANVTTMGGNAWGAFPHLQGPWNEQKNRGAEILGTWSNGEYV